MYLEVCHVQQQEVDDYMKRVLTSVISRCTSKRDCEIVRTHFLAIFFLNYLLGERMTAVSVRKERKVLWDIFALFFLSTGQNLFNQKSNQWNTENFAKGYRKHPFFPSTDHSFDFLSTLQDRQGGYKVFSLWRRKSQLWAVQIWCKMCSLWFYWWKDFRIWGGCVRMQLILNNRRRIQELLEFKKFK